MNRLLTCILSISFYAYCILLTIRQVHAAAEFSTSYNINYVVNEKGLTTTKQEITLKNLFENVYATEYSIIIGSTSISDIRASDNFGVIEPGIKKDTNSTTINLVFDKHIIGKEKTRVVTVTYTSPDFATVKGQVLEVGFPLLANNGDMADYNVNVQIPNYFGKATQIIPNPNDSNTYETYTNYLFDKDTLDNEDSISATFGTSQIYDFTLRYNLDNPNQVRGRTEIALPSDTNYQQVLYDSINPKPEQVNTDQDGNWLAQYLIDPGEKITVEAKGTIKLSYFPKKEFSKPLTEPEIQTYTSSDDYWDVDDPQIVTLAKTHTTPRQIYDYLVSELLYDYERLNNNTSRMGALKALANPENAICMEFTDAFIAIARAADIPAREHNGYAYTENDKLRPLSINQDVLHAWPEYFDLKTNQWIQIDPTWGKTTGGLNFFDKFDLDHISFVRHGVDSTYPVTAGSYKFEDQKSKDVEISFGAQFDINQDYSMQLLTPQTGLSGFPISGSAVISNTGNSAMYQIPYEVKLIHSGIDIQNMIENIPVLPPYGTFTKPISYSSDWKSRGGTYTYKIVSNSKEESTSFTIKPLIDIRLIIPLIALPTGLTIVLVYIHNRRKSQKLRTFQYLQGARSKW